MLKIKTLIFLFMLLITGCSSMETFIQRTPSPEKIGDIHKTPTAKSTSLGIQITYLKDSPDYTSSDLYGVDITCITSSKICFGDSHLIFKTVSQLVEQTDKPKGPIMDYSWSPDGNLLALELPEDIWVGDLRTQTWENLTNSSFKISEYEPKWTNDGKSIYFNSCIKNESKAKTCQRTKIDILGKEKHPVQLFRNGDYVLSPNGFTILFSSSDEDGTERIYLANEDGTNKHRLTTTDLKKDEYGAIFSPDGQKILFSLLTRNQSGQDSNDLILKDLTTGNERTLIENKSETLSPYGFSPEGLWALFLTYDKSLNGQIFVVSLSEKQLIQLPNSNGGAFPAWREFQK